MKRIMTALLAVTVLFALTACGSSNTDKETANTGAQQNSSTPEITDAPDEMPENTPSEAPETSQPSDSGDTQSAGEESGGSNILIAYFSRAGDNYNVGVIEKGNTEIIAEMIAEQTGGDLFHIETVTPYPEDYRECTNVAQQELQENARPELTATVDNFNDYDVVFLGYPNWWGDMPMAVYTFMESYDFSGKTIIPFATHEGSGLASTESSIASTCSGSEVLEGLAVRGSVAQNSREEAKEAVTNWLQETGFID
ncbi:MAG: flavodoxin [Eubacteriales bacterium]|nr:flavodoxin [Eubacteriales bacterium]